MFTLVTHQYCVTDSGSLRRVHLFSTCRTLENGTQYFQKIVFKEALIK